MLKEYMKIDGGLNADVLYHATKKIALGVRYSVGLNKINWRYNRPVPQYAEEFDYWIDGRHRIIQGYLSVKL